MEDKILQIDKDVTIYINLAQERSKQNDFLGALSFLFSAYKLEPDNLEVIIALADLYADMNLMEISNRYWFIFLDKAPKERYSIAYEQLAINYFYLDNYWASTYYFHEKISVDGFISREGLSQEIIDFFSGDELKKTAYRVVYPPERADYAYEVKKAKHFISLGAYQEGAQELSKIPLEQMDEDTCGELAVCYFMSDDLVKAEEVIRFSLKKHGENITAFCNLATVYDLKEDFDNSEYYYQKALSLRTGDKNEAYKITTCAIERNDHKNVCACIEQILEDRPYEQPMRFFYALAKANLNDYQGALDEIKKTYLIDPSDEVVKFYLDYIQDLNNETGDYLDILPFDYLKEVPEKIFEKWKSKIKKLSKHPDRIYNALKTQEYRAILSWGLKGKLDYLAHDCAYILSLCLTPFAKELIRSVMLNPEVSEERKRMLVYVMVAGGVKENFGVVAAGLYAKVKPKKLLCEKDREYGGLYLSAYALCISKTLFFKIKGIEKLAKICDRVYKKFKGVVTDAEVSNEEIAGFMVYLCGFDKYSEVNNITKFFVINEKKLKMLKKLFEGNKDDKNN